MPVDDLPERIRTLSIQGRDDVDVDDLWRRAQKRRRRRRLAAAVVSMVILVSGGIGAFALSGVDETEVETDLADPNTPDGSDPAQSSDCGSVMMDLLDPTTDLVVYLEPDSEPALVQTRADEIRSNPDVVAVTVLEQAEVFDQFRQVFADSPEIVSTVTPEILPYQLEVDVGSGEGGAIEARSQALVLELRLTMEREKLEGASSAAIREVVLRDDVGAMCIGSPTESSPDTTVPVIPTPFDAPVAAPPPVSEPPSEIIAVTADGRLVVIDSTSGIERRQLAASGDPTADPPPEGPGPNVIDAIAVSSDRATVWYSECCEPAGGALYRVPYDGSAPASRVADAYSPSVSANSRFVAVVTNIGSQIIDPIGDSGRIWADDRWQGEYQESAWSIDATRLVLRTGTPESGGLLLLNPTEFVETELGVTPNGPEPVVLAGSDWRLPTFRRDGQLLVAERTEDTWSPVLIDPATGTQAPADGLDYPGVLPLAQDFDATGEWLLVLTGTEAGVGQARIIGPDGSTTDLEGTFREVSW